MSFAQFHTQDQGTVQAEEVDVVRKEAVVKHIQVQRNEHVSRESCATQALSGLQ